MKMRKKAYLYAVSTLKEVSKESIIHAGFAMGNGSCHENSVAAVMAGRADHAWLALAGCENDCVVHFINERDGKFFDETWGFKSYTRFWLVRKLEPSEYERVPDILYEFKNLLICQMGNPIERLKAWRGRFDF